MTGVSPESSTWRPRIWPRRRRASSSVCWRWLAALAFARSARSDAAVAWASAVITQPPPVGDLGGAPFGLGAKFGVVVDEPPADSGPRRGTRWRSPRR